MAARYESGDLIKWYRSKQKVIEEGTEAALEEVGQIGAEEGKRIISTSHTGKRWVRPGPTGREGSFNGRIDTGKMINAFGYRINHPGNSAQVRIGWTGGTREDYFYLQNLGFHHAIADIDIEGMYAVQDASEYAFSQLPGLLKKEIGRGK